MSNFSSTPSTPIRRPSVRNPYKTFNNKQSHHDLYEILTYNIPEFHKYLKNNININVFDPYINIIQKPYYYDGETKTNSDKGEYIIEFIDQHSNKNSYFPKNKFKDVHFTLHKYSSIPNKLHFCFKVYKYNRGYNTYNLYLDLEYVDNEIDIKQNQKLNKFNNDDINKCEIIINTINNYISATIREKKEKCREIRNNNHRRRKRVRVNNTNTNTNTNTNPNLSSRFELELEEGEVPPSPIGGTKKKKNNKLNTIKKEDLIKICKKNKLKGYSKLNKEQLIKFIKKNI